MSKEEKTLKGIKTPSRRKFFKAAAATGAVAAATLAMPSIAKAATTLKVQAAWGGGIFLENAPAIKNRPPYIWTIISKTQTVGAFNAYRTKTS